MTNSDERHKKKNKRDEGKVESIKKHNENVVALSGFGADELTLAQSSPLSSGRWLVRSRLAGMAESLSSGFPVSTAG